LALFDYDKQRAMKVYTDRLEVLQESIKNKEDRVAQKTKDWIDSYNANLSQYNSIKDDAEALEKKLVDADDKDREIIKWAVETYGNSGTLPASVKESLKNQLSDPSMITALEEAVSIQNSAKLNADEIEWKSYVARGVAPYNKMTLDQFRQYKARQWGTEAGSSTSSAYKSPTAQQNKDLFYDWIESAGSGLFTTEQLESIAKSVGLDPSETELGNLIESNRTQKTGSGWFGLTHPQEATTTENPLTAFNNYKATQGFGVAGGTTGSGTKTVTVTSPDGRQITATLTESQIQQLISEGNTVQ